MSGPSKKAQTNRPTGSRREPPLSSSAPSPDAALAIVSVSAAAFVLVNLLVDLLYPWFDPRITHTPKVS